MNQARTRAVETVELPAPVFGTSVSMQFYRYGGAGSGPKAYLQGALHADEIPGLLVMRKLIDLFDRADARGEIHGEIIATPIANPLGLNQFSAGYLQGRYYAENARNFNRNFPDVFPSVVEGVSGQLGSDAAANVAIIRQALRDAVSALNADTAFDAMRLALLSRSIDADFVFDLHCDYESNLYFFTLPELWPQLQALAAYMGCDAALLAEPDPGNPFDEINSALWLRLAREFPESSIPLACVSTTLELRGRSDVDELTAQRDAEGIFAYLQRCGVIAGDPPPLPPSCCPATPYSWVAQLVAPLAGIVCYLREIGSRVEKGEPIIQLIPLDVEAEPVVLNAPTSGLFYSRHPERYTYPGRSLGEIAGTEALAEPKLSASLGDR